MTYNVSSGMLSCYTTTTCLFLLPFHTAQNSSNNLPFILQTIITVQMCIGREKELDELNVYANCSLCDTVTQIVQLCRVLTCRWCSQKQPQPKFLTVRKSSENVTDMANISSVVFFAHIVYCSSRLCVG